jgi:HEAT repeat protein
VTNDEAPDGTTEESPRRRSRLAPAAVLAAIRDPQQPIPQRDLTALSTPDDATVRTVMALWPELAPARRRELLASLQQLAEDDSTLDFHRLHLSALADPDAATRILAIRGLWEQEGEDVMRLLTELLRTDLEPDVRAEAAATLGQFVVTMEFGLLSEDGAEHLAEALRDAVEDPAEEDEVRGNALEALGAHSEEWVAELIADQYELGLPRMRLAALRAMGRHASDDWLPVLLHHFDDDDAEVRAAAAMAAGQLLLEDAVAPLTELADDVDEEVRLAAVAALGEIAGDAAEAALLQIAQRDPGLRDAARRALAEARLDSLDPGAQDD